MEPAPGNLYTSGADGILIRATLAHSVQKGWDAGVADICTTFLLDHGAHGTLQVPRHEKVTEAFADIGFAPQGIAVTKASLYVLQDLRFSGKHLGRHFTPWARLSLSWLGIVKLPPC